VSASNLTNSAAKSVLKALPTVGDHTTDQLCPEGDEYIPREYDEEREKKVTSTGRLLDGRNYRCQTFSVLNRGDKPFMLATECARVLGYRDSYLLFSKNKSLYKIVATSAEKEDLIHQEILPFSHKSRRIAIVTAKSMFRQFGSRVIDNGRRVRDDYWEEKARMQGFTEKDLAGEKRLSASKAGGVVLSRSLGKGSIPYALGDETEYSTDEIGDSPRSLDLCNAAQIVGRPDLPEPIPSPSTRNLVDRVMENFWKIFLDEIKSFR
jgi:Chromatin remodelling complex Rsc7/Swp82 subunit